MNKLLALFRANRGKGEGLRALADDGEPRLMVYDMIVSSDSDAEWLGGCSAESFMRKLAAMDAPRVHVHVNSPGGDAFAGIAMANAIRAFPGEVVVHVDGVAASAAGFLCAATPKVTMALGAMIMVHKSWTIAVGNSDDMMKCAEVLEKLDGQQAAMFAAKCPDYDWEDALRAETWFTGEEAVAIGLASEISEQAPPKALTFDLSAFEHAPQLPAAATPPAPEPSDDPEQLARRSRIARMHKYRNP